MKNIIKCNRCCSYLSAEDFESHKCILSLKEIPTKFYYEIENDKHELVIMAKGWNGVLYRFVKSKIESKIRSHICSSSKDLKGVVEIPIISYSKTEFDVIMAKGWNSVMYKIFESKAIFFTHQSDEFLQDNGTDADLTEP